jgi:uncharacterized delta-60 repeat protein
MKDLLHTALVFALLFQHARLSAQTWMQDPSFGLDGYVFVDGYTGADELMDLKIQADDGVLLLGWTAIVQAATNLTILVRLDADGTVDESFGDEGIFSVFLPGRSLIGRSMQLLADGGIMIAGGITEQPIQRDGALLRLLPNGILDPTFGTAGILQVDLGANEVFMSLIVGADGSLTVGGRQGGDVLLMRFDADGLPDPSFGVDGVLEFAAGSGSSTDVVRLAHRPGGGFFAMARISGGFVLGAWDDTGVPDPTFGGGGAVFIPVVGSSNALAVQPSGEVLVAGGGDNLIGDVCLGARLDRLLPNGSPDPDFGDQGVVVDGATDVCDILFDLLVQPDGSILVTGTFTNNIDIGSDFAVIRYLPDGSRDASFGDDGLIQVDMGCEAIDVSFALGLQSNGDIIVGGVSNCGPFPNDLAVVRLYPAISTASNTLVPSIADAMVHPNPAQHQVTLSYSLRNNGLVELELYDIHGRRMALQQARSMRNAGAHSAVLPVDDLSPGLYTMVLVAGRERSALRFVKE